MNSIVKDRFADKINAEFLIEAANPAFIPPIINSERIRKRTSKLRILWAPSPEPAVHPETGFKGDTEWPKRLGEGLKEVLAPLESVVELVMRPHPNHPDTVPDSCILDPIPDIWESLARTDILITTVSTVAIQARSLGIPTIVIEGSIVYDQTPLIDYGYATRHIAEEDIYFLGCKHYLNETIHIENNQPERLTDSVAKISSLVLSLAGSNIDALESDC